MISKPLLPVFLLFLGFALACKDNPSGPGSTHTLTGKIEGWQSDGNDNLYITVANSSSSCVLDSTSIAGDGAFSMSVPFPIPPDSMLRRPVAQQDSNAHYSKRDLRTISIPNASFVDLSLLVFDRHHLSRSLYSGNTFSTSDSLATVGDYWVQYYYFSEAATISGFYQLTFYDSLVIKQYGHSSFMTYYTLNVSAGWNAVVTQIISDVGQTRTYRVYAGDVAEKKWFAVWFISRSFEFASIL